MKIDEDEMELDKTTEIERTIKSQKKERRITCILMLFVVVAWGLDYVLAKKALDTLDPMCLLFYKYAAAFFLVFVIKCKMERGVWIRKKDILPFVLCAIFGEIAYFYCEYTAMDYIPISLISIIVSFVPVLSVLIERVVYKRKNSAKVVLGICLCIFGVVMIIGVDYRMLLQGKLIGYLLAFACVFSWNAYNFITASLHERYTSVTLTFNQLVCTLLLLLPYVIHRSPPVSTFTPELIWGLLYLGLISSGFGFLIQVKSLHVLGPTTASLFSNFLPVTATFFGWLILGETILPLQMAGGAIVIFAGYVVIKEKGKTEDESVG